MLPLTCHSTLVLLLLQLAAQHEDTCSKIAQRKLALKLNAFSRIAIVAARFSRQNSSVMHHFACRPDMHEDLFLHACQQQIPAKHEQRCK